LRGENQEQYIFYCRIVSGELGTGQGPEYQPDGPCEGEYKLEWIPKMEMKDKYILPEEIKNILLGN